GKDGTTLNLEGGGAEKRKKTKACWKYAATPTPDRQTLARRADLCRCSRVARRSKIHEGYSPSSRLAAAPNLQQRTRFLFMRWVLIIGASFQGHPGNHRTDTG